MTLRILLPVMLALLGMGRFDVLVRAQDPSDDNLVQMKLSPVVVQDVSGPATDLASETTQFELPAPSTPNPPAPRIISSDQLPIDDSRQKRLQRLNRPIGEVGVDGIHLSQHVSQLSFTSDGERYVTASDVRSLSSLETRTTYTRRPLYFEQRNLERCGESKCITCRGILTNPHCLGKFLVDTALVPFRMIRNPLKKPVVATAP